jgi:dihydrofolate reductase
VTLTLIAALTWPGRVIGKDNTIPWKLSEDLKRFKALTLGHPVIMGRKTWDSLPFKLPGRSNLVLSRSIGDIAGPKAVAPDLVCTSLDAALTLAAQEPGGEAVFVIGGASVYAEALPRADRLALTLVHHPFEGSVLFPAFDPKEWTEVFRLRQVERGSPSFAYEFVDLIRPQGEA